jgi:hypothetical protein
LAYPITEARIQTLILCNTYCYSTATVVMTVSEHYGIHTVPVLFEITFDVMVITIHFIL